MSRRRTCRGGQHVKKSLFFRGSVPGTGAGGGGTTPSQPSPSGGRAIGSVKRPRPKRQPRKEGENATCQWNMEPRNRQKGLVKQKCWKTALLRDGSEVVLLRRNECVPCNGRRRHLELAGAAALSAKANVDILNGGLLACASFLIIPGTAGGEKEDVSNLQPCPVLGYQTSSTAPKASIAHMSLHLEQVVAQKGIF